VNHEVGSKAIIVVDRDEQPVVELEIRGMREIEVDHGTADSVMRYEILPSGQWR
jgi:hypothetical protein